MTVRTNALSELRALSKIIQESIDSIEAAVTAESVEFPSAYTPLTMESEAARMLPEVEKACALIVSATSQLAFAVRSPLQSIVTVALQHQVSAALGVAAAANIAEACREAGPQGAHVRDLAHASHVDPAKLSRILRLLATNHVFVEVSPDVFANNRVSSALDTGKAVWALLQSPGTKHVGTLGIAAAVGHCTDEGMKAASYLQDVMLDPKLGPSTEPNDAALNAAFNTKLSAWEWFESPGNEHRQLRFGITMEGSKQAASLNAIKEGFDWDALESGSIVVDVGGGIGAQSMAITQTFPHLRVIVQDREQTVKDAVSFWEGQMPGVLQSGRVTLQAHDFFTPQPVKDASVFVVRQVLHDWPDKQCLDILRQLRGAATPNTRLIIIDNLMSYACVEEELRNIPGALRDLPPPPLLPNGGHSSTFAYTEDMLMLEMSNGQERTIRQVKELMARSGWKLESVHRSAPSAWSTQKAIGVPV
ncbi:hypothetical protein PHLGIDRAFT_85462 [Phlebiopsis gigantea 11061_1 CR5-6]|uniref:Uncharacterized protein n=1 Tax=Phlebiopsis gigantea (strain 11061_1 CR5-6) TaxID=745531 RepID=A0A0C3NXW2_PHLG1|nr:hypothetical protein PHLGIDRAFT_85462 [Phlebiopsis gigantea 11061_1 CR5-6]